MSDSRTDVGKYLTGGQCFIASCVPFVAPVVRPWHISLKNTPTNYQTNLNDIVTRCLLELVILQRRSYYYSRPLMSCQPRDIDAEADF
jgi:hypothetical protein